MPNCYTCISKLHIWRHYTNHRLHRVPFSACASCFAIRCIFNKNLLTSSTRRSSQTVTHPSTNRALCRLTSEFKWDRVNTSQCGRWRMAGVEYFGGEFLEIMLTFIGYRYYFMTLQHIGVRQIGTTQDICLLRFSMYWLLLLITIAKHAGGGLITCALWVRRQSFELQRPILTVSWSFRNVSTAATTAFIFHSRCTVPKYRRIHTHRAWINSPRQTKIAVERNTCSMKVYSCTRIEGVLHMHSVYTLESWTAPVWHSECFTTASTSSQS